jgi:hypothetical protein
LRLPWPPTLITYDLNDQVFGKLYDPYGYGNTALFEREALPLIDVGGFLRGGLSAFLGAIEI